MLFITSQIEIVQLMMKYRHILKTHGQLLKMKTTKRKKCTGYTQEVTQHLVLIPISMKAISMINMQAVMEGPQMSSSKNPMYGF